MERRHAERRDYERAISGVDFPASRAGLIRAAEDKGGIDTEVVHMLNQLPDRTFETAVELFSAIEEAYEAAGGLAGGGSAADPETVQRPPQPVTDGSRGGA
jgi:hypothetical protein